MDDGEDDTLPCNDLSKEQYHDVVGKDLVDVPVGRGEGRSVVLIVTDGLMVGGGGVVVLGNTVCNGRMTTCLKPWWSCWLL